MSMIEKYEKYLVKINGYLEKFFEQQKPYIHCKEGCSLCCENGEYPFSKIEFEYAMIGYQNLSDEEKKIVDENAKELKKKKENAINDAKNGKTKEKFLYVCPFLINNKCSIYSHRGLICRSYGLMFFMQNKEGKLEYKKPYCSELGLNYSNVLDKETSVISSEMWKETGIEEEPLSYNVGLDFLIDNNMTKELGLEFGEQKAIIDWFGN